MNLSLNGMLGSPVVEAQAAQLGPGQVHGHVVWRVGERSAEVSGLRVVAEQHERHARHEADVFETLPVGTRWSAADAGIREFRWQ